MSDSILNTLKKFGINLTYLRKNLVGLAVDGQYVQLGVINHIKTALVREDIPVSWDPMHRLELVQVHSDSKIVQDSLALINTCMKEFMWGKSFESLNECAD